jgi:hypothetical protein
MNPDKMDSRRECKEIAKSVLLSDREETAG